ncbi:hypothetical protein PAPYR_7599 [Paratrimastix pyriformis]|uniref:Ubiquitin-like protease family profile domain-containing protein n=1 Tax=Paratrimastix pyriformis TaxID=342808 RepID=A0ABQ8UCU0_9EUKA|nr:hypothetical protein PAPYR_7599 [Paratrimastix pyriformis]
MRVGRHASDAPPPPPLPPPPSPPPPSTPTLDESAGPTRPPPNESAETDEPPPPPPRSPLCESGDTQSEARSKYDLCFPIANIPSQVQSYFFAFNIFHEDLACVRSHDFLPSRFMDVYLRAIRHLFASRTPFDFIPSLCHLQPNARYVCGMPGCRFVACPIHTEVRGGGHFVLFVYDIEDQILFLLDSMRPLQSPAPSECGHLLPLFGVTDYIPLDVARRHQHLGAECLCEVCSYVLFLARRWDEFVMDPEIILADDVTRRVTREDLDLLVTSPETFAAKMVDM